MSAADSAGPLAGHAGPIPPPRSRGPIEGALNFTRFNWPLYVAGTAATAIGIGGWALLPAPLSQIGLAGGLLALWWTAFSAVAAWWTYDASGIYTWQILAGAAPARWVHIHAGLDESSPTLLALFPEARGRILDITTPGLTTEASLDRAREMGLNLLPAEPASCDALPLEAGSQDAIFLLFAAHEVRREVPRTALFREIHRSLAPGGRAVVVEHLRDLPNFIAFGPGLGHFYSARAWRRVFAAAGFAPPEERSVTPFVRVFTLRR